jgi:hypothetical protein
MTKKNSKNTQNMSDKIAILSTREQQLMSTIESLTYSKRPLEEENQRLAQDLSAKTSDQLNTLIQSNPIPSSRVNLDSRLLTVQPQKEKPSTTKFIPSHPIDFVSLEKLTTEQLQKIEEIKSKNLDNSFAEDWVIEYFVINYPNNTVEKLKEAEKTLIEWKEKLSNEDFKDNWILKHFIVYYPKSYDDHYVKSEIAFIYLTSKYGNYEFANSNFLKHFAVYYYNNRTEVIERAKRLYYELKNKFLTTELINYNSSILTLYLIRNLNDPENDLKNANTLFKLFLEKAINDQNNFFYSSGKDELKTKDYLRLLFSVSPLPSNSLINNIQKAYQQLKTEYIDDDFMGKYKNLAFKKISILFSEKPVLNYKKLVLAIQKDLSNPLNRGIDRNDIIQIHLCIPKRKIQDSINMLREKNKK